MSGVCLIWFWCVWYDFCGKKWPHHLVIRFVFYLSNWPRSKSNSLWCVYSSMNCVPIGSNNTMSPVRTQPIADPMLKYCQLDSWKTLRGNFFTLHSDLNILMVQFIFCTFVDFGPGSQNRHQWRQAFIESSMTQWCIYASTGVYEILFYFRH